MILLALMIYASLRRNHAIPEVGPVAGYGRGPDFEYSQLSDVSDISCSEMKIISGTFLIGI